MKTNKNNAGLLDQKKFAKISESHDNWLKNLSLKEAIVLEEKMMSSCLIFEWRGNFEEDKPISVRLGLAKK